MLPFGLLVGLLAFIYSYGGWRLTKRLLPAWLFLWLAVPPPFNWDADFITWLKFVTASMLLQPHFSEEWLSTGRIVGLACGLIAFVPLRRLSRSVRIYLGLVTILAGALLAKIFGAYSPADELVRLFRWPHGQLGSFATLTRFLHELWPVAAIVFLIGLFFRERRLAAESKMEP